MLTSDSAQHDVKALMAMLVSFEKYAKGKQHV